MNKRGPRGRNWTPEERIIIFRMIMKGHDLISLNQALKAYQKNVSLSIREVPDSSFSMLVKTYLPYLTNENIEKFALKPPPMGDLKKHS